MTRKLPPLNAVRAFEEAGRHVSFTNAAVELNVTHGAVSRQVALLEGWLGTPLFRRTASKLALTDVGSLKFEQMYFALQAASEGLGVVLVPLFLAIDDIIAGRLCTPFGPLAAKQRVYFANAPHANPIIDCFHEWLLREERDTEESMAMWAKSAG